MIILKIKILVRSAKFLKQTISSLISSIMLLLHIKNGFTQISSKLVAYVTLAEETIQSTVGKVSAKVIGVNGFAIESNAKQIFILNMDLHRYVVQPMSLLANTAVHAEENIPIQ